MARRIVFSLLLALALVWPAAAQSGEQQPPDAPAPQPNATQSAPPAPADPSSQDDQKQDQKKKKKGNPITRTIKRAAPDCINIGTSYCRDESKKDDGDQQPSEVPANQPVPRSGSHEKPGSSSSADTQIDLSPPPGDSAHPGADSSGVSEFHPWDPHRAAKDIEVGDFYFKKSNFRAAESRYREALQFKPNDAVATFKLAETLDREHNAAEAKGFYEQYLKILPSGEFAPRAQEALERLKQAPAANPDTAKK